MVIHGLKSSERVICKDRKGALANYSSLSLGLPGSSCWFARLAIHFNSFNATKMHSVQFSKECFQTSQSLRLLKFIGREKGKKMYFFSTCLSNSFGKDPRENQCEEKHLL